MVDKRARGLTDQQAVHKADLNRDSRSPLTRLFHSLANPQTLAIALAVLAVSVLFVPFLSDFILVVGLGFTFFGVKRVETAALKLPIQSGMPDPNNGNKPAEGIMYIGFCMETKKEIWLTNDDCRQHFLVLGTTGAGKTVTLIGFVANALTWSSGFLFCDGKGDVSLFANIFALARRFGREDDVLVLNFMTGNSDIGKSNGKVLSNTLNPFASGSSDSLTQMVVGLMDDAGGDGAMWKGRAQAMFTGVMRALGWLRDAGQIDLNVGVIRDHLNLRQIIDLCDKTKYPHMPPSVRKSINSYLTSLPGYQPEKGYKQAQTTLDQHGYLEMQFTRIMGSLADVYGHIFFTPFGEVDMQDVVLNRRILVVMLPALEMSGDEIANLGKIVVANLKGMMGSALGSAIQGRWETIVDKRLTNAPSPFLVVLDEVGYYCVEGMALMCAQARSLGFSIVLASQDIPAMKRLNDKEAESIIANTNTKIFMRTEEMSQTGDLAVKSAGKGMRAMTGGYQGQAGGLSGVNYTDGMDARFEEIDRVDLLDLKSQEAGEMTVMHSDFVIRSKSFFANPAGHIDKSKLDLGTNHFIKVPKPSLDEIESATRIPAIFERILDPDFAQEMMELQQAAVDKLPEMAAAGDEMALAITGFDDYIARKRNSGPTEAVCAAMAQVVRSFKTSGESFARQFSRGALEDVAALAAAGAGGGGGVRRETAFAGRPADFDEPPQPFGGDHDRQGWNDRDAMFQGGPTGDALDGLDDMDFPPPRAPGPEDQPHQGPRRPVKMRNDVVHGVDINGEALEDVSMAPENNDAVLRMLADLDYDVDRATPDDVEMRLRVSSGAPDDPYFDQTASSEAIDQVAYAAEKVLPEPPQATDDFVSDFLDGLMEAGAQGEEDGDGDQTGRS